MAEGLRERGSFEELDGVEDGVVDAPAEGDADEEPGGENCRAG